MNELVGSAVGVAGLSVLLVGVLIGRMLARYRNGMEEVPAAADVSTERYGVMARLSSPEDVQFLRTLPGFREEMAGKFRREQRRIYRLYLQEIAADFRRLHRAARLLLRHAPEEHSALVGVLFRHQVRFWQSLAMIELRLTLGAAGIRGIDLRQLLGTVDELRIAVARVSSGPASLPA